MSQNLGSLSFLSRFDPSEFYEIAKDLPSSIELNNIDLTNSGTNSSTTSYDANFIVNNIDRNSSYEDTASSEVIGAAAALDTNIEIIGTHLLIPQNSIAQMLEANKDIIDSTIIDFDSFANMMPQPAQNDDTTIIPAASNLPSYETFFGPYNFRINIASSDIPVKKSASWTYSSKLNKLYSIPGVACPVEMSVSSMPPYGTQVRVMAVFAKFEHIQDLITRCENHKKSKEFSSDDFPDQALSHFVRCRHPMANYVQDMSNLRESVQIPFERPTTGSNSTTVLLQFMCYSSCIGGSQKPVRIVLTLEHNGEILGRNSFEVKICACPGRDRTTDEKKSNKDKNEEKPTAKTAQNQKADNDSKNTTNKNKLADNKSTTTSQVATNNTNKKIDQINIKSVCMPHEDEDEEIFTIKVRGRKNYEILKNLNEALEIQHKLYSKLKKTGDGKLGEIVTGENLSRVISRGSSFIFNNNKSPANSNNLSTNKSPQKPKNIPNNLEEFLSQIDLIAYYNIIVSKGIKTIDDLVNASKKKINSLKISERDTTLIFNAIEELKARREGKEAVEDENEKSSGAKKPKLVDSSSATNQLINDQPTTSKNAEESFVKLSKYQIRYSSFKKNDN